MLRPDCVAKHRYGNWIELGTQNGALPSPKTLHRHQRLIFLCDICELKSVQPNWCTQHFDPLAGLNSQDRGLSVNECRANPLVWLRISFAHRNLVGWRRLAIPRARFWARGTPHPLPRGLCPDSLVLKVLSSVTS